MVSGPDLGGGYLHQLTVDRHGALLRFTFHAQIGGVDASGPPLGPLDPFGFVHPPSPCQFGGPRCFHRSFELPTASEASVRLAYNRFRFVLATLLEQQYGGRAPGIESALAEIAGRLGGAPSRADRWWYVGGSTAAFLQGASVVPNDVDLGVGEAGIPWVAEQLREYLIEPLAQTEWAGRRMFGARAFVGTMREGARTEWGLPHPGAKGDRGRFDEWSGDPLRVRTRTVSFHGMEFVVTRPEYALVRSLEKGREERAGAIRALLSSLGVDRDLLTELLARSSLAPDRRRAEEKKLYG